MYLNFVWHFHQPIYHQPDSQDYILPWVNYHTTRNYWQMLKIIEDTEFPCTINLVPCLLEQIIDYANGKAVDPVWISLMKPSRELTQEDLSRLKRFFPQYHSINSASELQRLVLDSFFSPLVRPQEKKPEDLLELREKIFSGILNYFKDLKTKGLLELTTSPYFHPILPLLIDLSLANSEVPELPEFTYPEDAFWHLSHGRQYFQDKLGFLPKGLWPSEGALSQQTCELIARAGFKFTLTDEHLLWKSLDHRPDPQLLFQPYECAGVKILFRDRELSDLISFEYHRWPAEQAVADFMRKLEKRTQASGEEALCSIILDGENPWGVYNNNGVDFLRLLFERIKATQNLQPILPQTYLENHQSAASLKLIPGTWMSSFFKWVGHPDKVKSWKRLSGVRQKHPFSTYLAVAEGSDWFWWSGESEEIEFELLFSNYLEKASKIG